MKQSRELKKLKKKQGRSLSVRSRYDYSILYIFSFQTVLSCFLLILGSFGCLNMDIRYHVCLWNLWPFLCIFFFLPDSSLALLALIMNNLSIPLFYEWLEYGPITESDYQKSHSCFLFIPPVLAHGCHLKWGSIRSWFSWFPLAISSVLALLLSLFFLFPYFW